MISVVGDAFGVSAAPGIRSKLHAPHGVELIIGLEGEVTVTHPGGSVARGRAVLIPPDVPRVYDSPGLTLGTLYDPHRFSELASHARELRTACPLQTSLAARLLDAAGAHRSALAQPDVLTGIAGELARVFPAAPRRPMDRRVARLLEALQDPRAERATLLVRVGISEAHLQALFVRDVGVPIRTYQRWHRLLTAVLALRQVDATRAAHRAGFADLAHFSRTCTQMLGHAPTVMRSALRQADAAAG